MSKLINVTLSAALSRENRTADQDIDAGITEAIQFNLHRPTSNALDGLRKWAGSTSIAMPPPWKAQMTRYARWLSTASLDDADADVADRDF
jgi:hypothetical protein